MSLAGLVVSWGVMTFTVDVLDWHYLSGALLVCVIVPILNFFVLRGWVFTVRRGETAYCGWRAAMSERKASQVTQSQVARDFDNVATDYEDQINSAIAFAGREHAFYIDIKREHILRLARKHFRDLRDLDVLDLGCGLGAYHSGLEGKFRELNGVDVSARSIELAAAQHPFVHYSTFDGIRLPYRDGQFSIVFTVCVMHHVPPPQWTRFAAEMFRVTGGRPGARIRAQSL